MTKRGAELRLVTPRRKQTAREKTEGSPSPLSTIALFCGAGGIKEGFREAGHRRRI